MELSGCRVNQPNIPGPYILNPTYQTQSANPNVPESQQAESSQIPPQNKVSYFSTINIDGLVTIIASKGRDNVRSSIRFQQNEEVRRAMGSNAWPRSNEPIPFKSEKDELVSIGEEYFLIINENFDSIRRFSSRLNYISYFLSYYFSEKNLFKDEYMMQVLTMNDGVYPLENLLQFSRLRAIEATESELRESANSIDYISFDLHNGVAVFKVLCLYVLNKLAAKATSQIGREVKISLLPVTYPNVPTLPVDPCLHGLPLLQFLQMCNVPTPMPTTQTLTPNFPSQHYGFQRMNSQGIFLPGPVL
nr:hypothetical protein HmN_000310200 [Hymenolepis microstoma]